MPRLSMLLTTLIAAVPVTTPVALGNGWDKAVAGDVRLFGPDIFPEPLTDEEVQEILAEAQ